MFLYNVMEKPVQHMLSKDRRGCRWSQKEVVETLYDMKSTQCSYICVQITDPDCLDVRRL